MFKGPQVMSLTGNADAATASAATATSAAVAIPVATTATEKNKMCASSLIFRATKWCLSYEK